MWKRENGSYDCASTNLVGEAYRLSAEPSTREIGLAMFMQFAYVGDLWWWGWVGEGGSGWSMFW